MAQAATKADKIRRRRGRPRKESVLREPNGQASRAKDPPHKLAIEARAKMLGITVLEANDPDGATFIGYLHLAFKRWDREWEAFRKRGGKEPPQNPPADCLTPKQYDAALKFLDLRNQFLRSKSAPEAYYEAGRPSHLSQEERDDAHAKWADDVEKRYTSVRDAIQRCQDIHREENVWAAVDLVLINDHRLPHMIGATRTLCNCLVKHFRC